MNKLSWLLYAAGALDGLHTLALAGAIVCAVAAAIWWFVIMVATGDGDVPVPPYPPKWLYASVLLFGALCSVIPSATTVYMIAGSEASEVAVKSEIGQKVMTAVEKAIDSYTKEDNR